MSDPADNVPAIALEVVTLNRPSILRDAMGDILTDAAGEILFDADDTQA